MRYAEEQAAKIEAALEDVSIDDHSLILDVGCGTGILFNRVADRAEILVGLDVSRRMLLQARKSAEKLRNVHLILADVDNIPVKAKVFDCVFAVTLLQNTPNPVKTLKEIKRITKGSAVIVVTGMKKAFTLRSFKKMLTDAGLRIVALKKDGLKCYVAACEKRGL
jgi:ubiquinone/menaquinone biosynthesis C-methylase UbiE